MKKINPKDIRAGQDFIAAVKLNPAERYSAKAASSSDPEGIRTEYWLGPSGLRYLYGFFEYDQYDFYVEDKQTEQTMQNIQIQELQVGDVFFARYQGNIKNPTMCGVVTAMDTGAYGPKVHADYYNCGGCDKKTTFMGKGIFTDGYSFILVNRPVAASPATSSNTLVGKRAIQSLGSSGIEHKIIEQCGDWIKLDGGSWWKYNEEKFIILND